MWKRSRLVLPAVGILFLLFVIMTFIRAVTQPSISPIRVIEYGYPFLWIRVTTDLPGSVNPQFTLITLNLVIDILVYAAVSFLASYYISRSRPKETINWRTGSLIIAGMVGLAYLSKLFATVIHEVVGHGFFAWILGAHDINYSINLIGHGETTWVAALTPHNTAIVVASGIMMSSIIGWTIILYLYLTKDRINKKKILRIPLLWVASWLLVSQAGYMVLGGLTGFGDIGVLHSVENISLESMLLLGCIYFFLSYISITILFISEVAPITGRQNRKMTLVLFWLIVPVSLATFSITYSYAIPFFEFSLLVVLSFIPLLISVPVYSVLKEFSSTPE